MRLWRDGADVSSVDDFMSPAEQAELEARVRAELRRGSLSVAEVTELHQTTVRFERSWLRAHPVYLEHVAALVEREREALAKEMESWPAETDCDRLSRVFAQLNEEGVVALECCGISVYDGGAACGEELDRRLDSGEWSEAPATQKWVFYHSQDLDHVFEDRALSLAYGAVDAETGASEPEASRSLAKRVIELLEQEGLSVKWSGAPDERLVVEDIDWRRRKPLQRS